MNPIWLWLRRSGHAPSLYNGAVATVSLLTESSFRPFPEPSASARPCLLPTTHALDICAAAWGMNGLLQAWPGPVSPHFVSMSHERTSSKPIKLPFIAPQSTA
jgi:hypothetical protein